MQGLLKRYAHRWGHGVHSPFAFRFLTDIIRHPRGVAYYSGRRLRYMLRNEARATRREYKMLFRLVARLRPQSIFLLVKDCEQLSRVLHYACTHASFRHCMPSEIPANSLIITDASQASSELLNRDGNILYVREIPASKSRKIAGSMKGGWAFIDSHRAIFVSSLGETQNCIYVKI